MRLTFPSLEHVSSLTVELAPIRTLGPGRAGERRIIPIVGGTAAGPLISGRVLNVGADWQTVFRNGVAELDTRYALETNDGATIEIVNYGYRHGPTEVIDAIGRGEEVDPDAYYMRTQARLECGDARYDWVNKTLFIGSGARAANSVCLALYAVR